MAETSAIEWTDATWNPVTGCSVVSPGCANCYAMRLAGTRLQHHPSRAGLTTLSKAGPVWNGQVRLNEQWLTQPLAWKRPRRIFVAAHGDLFHEAVPDAWIDRVFAVMALAPRHTFQVLTKRAARMRAYCRALTMKRLGDAVPKGTWPISFHGAAARLDPDTTNEHRALYGATKVTLPLPNVWLGVSAEDQVRADARIPDLLATPAAVRFLSAEPLLGSIDIAWALSHPIELASGFLKRGQFSPGLETLRRLDWVIAGGESGPGARPMHPDWARRLRDACAAAGTAFFFKQWGEWGPDQRGSFKDLVFLRPDGTRGGFCERGAAELELRGKKAAGRLLDGAEHDAMPAGR